MATLTETARRSRLISALLYVQSLALFGFFSLDLFPHFIRKLGVQANPTFFFRDETATILVASCLFLSARSIKLRRRRAWIFATTLQTLLIVFSVIRSVHIFLELNRNPHLFLQTLGLSRLVFEIVILALLLRYRNIFKTIADPYTRRQGVIFFIRSSLLALLLGVVIIYFDRHSFLAPVGLGQAIEITIKGLVGVSGPVLFVSVARQERLELLLGGLGILIAVGTLIRFLKPALLKSALSSENAHLVRGLLEHSSKRDSLSYFALRDNKSVVWSPNMKAVIPYSVRSSVMISTGDPIGDQESWPAAMAAFLNTAEMHAWIPAIYGCSEEAGEIWVRETGFDSLEIGDEAVVVVKDFTTEGPVMKNVRQTLNRINRLGYTAKSAFVRDLDERFREDLAEKMQQWRKSQDERGFSMALGRFCDPIDPDCLITWCERENEVVSMLQFVPWGDNSVSLDLMRRAPNADTGVNELMIQQTINFVKPLGFEYVSLNFASFRSIFEKGKKLGAGPVARVMRKILIFFSHFVQIESLYRFNAKFAPLWEPRYIVFPSIGNIVRVGYAILRIEGLFPEFSEMLPKRAKHKL